jgi:sulfotransferase 6B1
VVNPDLILRLLRRWARKRVAQRKFPATSSKSLPILFANSFPKSGTHLLTQILSGFTKMGPFVESGLPAVVTFAGETGERRALKRIIQDLQRFLPGDIGYGHLHASPEITALLTNKKMASFFIYRDPRDVAVSHAYYVADINQSHVHHQFYANELADFDQRLRMSITGRPESSPPFPDIASRFQPYIGWLQQAAVLSIRYEDSVQRPDDFIGAVFDHVTARGFRFGGGRGEALRVLADSVHPEKSPTFRKGMIGGWKDHFNQEHKALFKQFCGELLVDLGYEKNLNW